MKRFVLAVSLMLLSGSVAAQQASILGRVIDAASKEPLIGVRVTFDAEHLHDSLKSHFATRGAISNADGVFALYGLDTGVYILKLTYDRYQDAYVEFPATMGARDTLYALMEREVAGEDVTVQAEVNIRTIEDLCCRVEALNAELTNVAPFTPSMEQVMRRYASCTAYQINCTIDGSASVRLRGLSNPYTLMLIDGAPLVGAVASQYGLQMLPSLATENVRIIEGASTTVYGNNAIAGVTSFDLLMPTTERKLYLHTNYAGVSQDGLGEEYDLNLGYSNSFEQLAVASHVNLSSRPGEGGSDPGSARMGYNRYSGFARLIAEPWPDARFTFTGIGGHDSRAGTGISEELGITINNVIAKYEQSLSDMTALTVMGGVSLAEFQLVSNALRLASDLVPYVRPMHVENDVTVAQAILTHATGAHYITVGAEVREEDIEDLTQVSNLDQYNVNYYYVTHSGFLEDQIALSNAWTLLVGGRFDRHSIAGNVFSPRGSLSWKPTTDLRIRLMAGQGIKGQALFNEDHRILHSLYTYRPNPNFAFEKSFTLNYDMTYGYIIGDIAGEINLNAYHTTIAHKAIPHQDSLANGTIYFVNSPEPARLMGVEIQTRPTFGEHWSGTIAGSVVNLFQQYSGGRSERVALSPTINVDLSLMYHLDEEGFAVETWGSFIGAQRLPSNPYRETSPEIVIGNVRLQKRLGVFTLHAGVLNLLDTEQTDTMPLAFPGRNGLYDTTVGWGPLEGREFFIGARVDL